MTNARTAQLPTTDETTPYGELSSAQDVRTGGLSAHSTDELVEESLVEEVSIDGMCGVY